MISQKGKKVYVGLSGGVDSAVSLALLQKAGYDVTGVFIKVWQPDWIECSSREDRHDAMRVAAHLNVPFVTLDLEKEYKEGVIDYMISEYKVGRTPNPDVMCNREVKFGAFWKWAKNNGADYIATGHYAQVTPDRKMLMGNDSNKDQTYFLWTLERSDLSHVLFPVGHLPKPEVRKLAKKFHLPNAVKKDSQGLCFIGKIDVKDFLRHYIKEQPGNVLDNKGKIIGLHTGALLYTIGERHGFEIYSKTPNDTPYYVISKNVEQNTITVSNKKDNDILPGGKNEVELEKVTWVSGKPPEGNHVIHSFPFQTRSRYRQELQNVRIISASDGKAKIEFENIQDTLTPGQSLVIYKDEECLGGGIIL
ncbi:MAG: tRNA 2-thiouridine(34) synthase MnmA [Candidatus Paceibacterota bacterium]